ncbi:MAG: PilZ domain-containing protein [Polyangia bacterium]|jgi:Tfp pilus assembly protein PilZ|nr:PilZ domain-containing protein [Polyangia bacterium]
MKKRPWIVLLFSAACALFPLYLLLQTKLLKAAPLGEAARDMLWPSAPIVFAGENLFAIALVWFVAYAVYRVRSWSWYLALVTFAGLSAQAAYMFLNRAQGVPDASLWLFTLLTATPAVALVVLVQREIRAPYFNPRIRWWEAEPRFPIEATLTDGGKVRDISRLGLFVQQDPPPAVGTQGEWQLQIEGKTLPIKGEVAWVSEVGSAHPPGFGLRFGALEEGTKLAIDQILEERRRLGRKEWGERGVRYPTDIRCGDDAVVLDISPGGMFVHTEEQRRLGEQVEYPLRHGRHEFKITGKVVWLSRGSGAYPPGFGVRFVKLDPDTRAMLSLLIHDLWRAHSEPIPRQS